MEDLKALSSQVASVIGDLDAEPVLRGLEVICSMISWTVLSSAHRDGYDGLYQYDHYTPLNFLLTAGILHWGYAIGIFLVKHSTLLEQDLLEKCEFYGTAATVAFGYTAFIAGASCSTQLHDEFDGASICSPRHRQRIAYSFCSRVGASVAFSFFATLAAAASFALVFARQRTRWQATSSSSSPDSYNPIGSLGDDDEVSLPSSYPETPPVAYGVPMEGVGSSDQQQPIDAAVDL